MMRYAVAIVVAIAAIWLARRSSLPSFTHLALGAEHVDEDDPTDVDARVATHAPVAAAPYDPWNPPPLDPSRPHLPEPDLPRGDRVTFRAYYDTLHDAVPALQRCYRDRNSSEPLTALIEIETARDDQLATIHVVDSDYAPLPDLDDCLRAATGALELPPLPDERTFTFKHRIVLTPEPDGSGSG